MQQHPTTGVIGGKPKTRLKTAKEQIPELSKIYLEERNQQMRHKNMAAQLDLAIRRGQLISKDLAVKQASFLMIALRQRLLNLSSHTHKLVGLDCRCDEKGIAGNRCQHAQRDQGSAIGSDRCALVQETGG